ncbi:28S ribosomal protein S28 mitochondrial [Taenia crassiceps]|uniref:28S ribosomal protein S28 mitochondrial n=1 Tax=Taenia crassiceps TaxID=6207 RepID=A0ABR4QQG8_9CEST
MVARLCTFVGVLARCGWSDSVKHIPWHSHPIRVPSIRQVRSLSSAGGSDESDKNVNINEGTMVLLLKQADGKSVPNDEKRILQNSVLSQPPTPELSSDTSPRKKVDDTIRRQSSAPRLVPWTSNRFLKERKIVKSTANSEGRSFVAMLRESTFVQLGNFTQRELMGVVIENVNDSDLYVDIGGKFLAVVSQPENTFYPRGSLVRVRLRDPEMANRFMVNTRAISLLEADATLLGPYRGQLISTDMAATNHQVNKEVVSLEHWKLS